MTFRSYLLVCGFFALLNGNRADVFSFHEAFHDAFPQNVDIPSDVNYRLPTSVKPILYEIALIPKLQYPFSFTGITKINAILINDTNIITLHVGNINITSKSVVINQRRLQILEDTYENSTDKYIMILNETLTKGSEIQIAFEHKGILRDDLIGFYKSSYVNEKGLITYLAATQFQTIHARHVFPCFDEPNLKAKFLIRISTDKGYSYLSNMPLNMTEDLDGTVWNTFNLSIPMSTYLVAFIISDFHSLKKEEFTVWARPSVINQAKYALNIGTKALAMFNDLFLEKYNLPKMDMVAVPDFAAGAMENWGLVTYREALMLYDEEESSALTQQKVASTILHELTHMWFGNLVTPEWWSYLWLSEGFARYFQYFGTAKIETSWKMEQQFIVEQHQIVLIVDSLESSQPMTRNISSKLQIAGIGDSITYAKGASIIRMINLIFGTNVFELTLRDYLQKNKAEGLSHPDDLWTALQNQINNENATVSVKTIMDTWTTQAGYPVINVIIDEQNKINITQHRFFLRNLSGTSTNVIWKVPLTWVTKSNPNFNDTSVKHWLFTKNCTLNVNINSAEWIIFNAQSSGFYRVNYNYNGWKRIFASLYSNNLNKIHVLNRAAIVDDLLNLGRAGHLNYEIVLDGITYLTQEKDYLPLKAAINGLNYLNTRLLTQEQEGYSLFKRYALSLIEDRRKNLGYEDRINDDRLTVLLRQELNNWACKLGDKECVTTYVNKFKQWKADPSSRIKPNERITAYCTSIRNGTREDWNFLWQIYYDSNNVTDQIAIIKALGCTEDITNLKRYLRFAITDYEINRIRKHDSTTVFAAVYESSLIGAEYVIDFIIEYYKDMEEYYGGLNTVASILDGVSKYLTTQESLNHFQNLINNHKREFKPILESLESSLEIARYELSWTKEASVPIFRWLKAYFDDRDNKNKYRLPPSIKPEKYTVFVTPFLESGNFTFDGNVTIEATVIQATEKIVLHSAEIKHHKLSVMANQIELKNINSSIEKKYDFYIINLNKKLSIGTKLIIKIIYTGHMNISDFRGFYKGSYINKDGETRWFAATQLEPVGARKMFPCFDEPALKAFFTIQVSVPSGYNAISNMEIKFVSHINNRRLITFHESVRMSTYLVALIISDFKSKDLKIDTRKYAVWAQPNAINQTNHALYLISPFVQFFENRLNQTYQLPKLDMIALPDFPSGAMENWGLLTYKETNLLYDENNSPDTSKQIISNIIAHEISHQWFGNLVTPEWWEYIWLNEGFARYFQYHTTINVLDTTLELQFVVDQLHSALHADSSAFTHAMSCKVYTPDEIKGIFDTISYAKSASILRMIEKSYGTDLFYNALSNYLNKRQYNISTPEDLYEAIQVQINNLKLKDNIKIIMDTWTTKPGYPVVHICIENNTATVKQERFFIKRQKNDSNIWHIPITWTSIENGNYYNTTPKQWLIKKEDKIILGGNSNDTFIFNIQQTGFYRVNYDREYWLKIINHLKNNSLDMIKEINRAALVDDLMNFARADYIDYEIAISATTYLKKENDYFPWRAFYNNLPYLDKRFRGRDIETLYNKYLKSLIEPLYNRLGFKDDKGNDNQTRLTNMLKMYTRMWACQLNVTDCISQSSLYFTSWTTKKEPVPPNYRNVVYCTIIRRDNSNITYDTLWQQYLHSNVTTDKLVILNSLTCSLNKTHLKTLLLTAVTENSPIRRQDSMKVFSDVYDASLIGVEAVMEVIKEDYCIIYEYFGGYEKIKIIMNSLAHYLSTYDVYKQYKDLLDWLITKEPAFENLKSVGLSNAQYEFDWYEKKVPIIFKILDQLFPDDTYRLPKTLYPIQYNISLIPELEKHTFEGIVQIYIKIKRDTTCIVLNSHDLTNITIRIVRNYTANDGHLELREIPVLEHKTNKTFQQLKIYLKEFIHVGKIIITEIKFTGVLNNDMKGFYSSSYLDSNNKLHWLATTQFEPIYARRAFPCFDEPAFKSNFTINMKRPKHYNTLSNMNIVRYINVENDNYVWDIFESTETMSPYLVAFVVSEFKPVVDSPAFINVWARPEVACYGNHARIIGMKLINELQIFTNINYSFPKIDLVGIPDFSMGAMENWGLATFREHGLFHDERGTIGTNKKYIITIIAHELAHMWFGNLVTCEWWEYIWLNEGFAQYFQWFMADLIEPSYKFMDQFVVYELQPALLKDSLGQTHTMTNPVNTPKEINNIFDYVTYGKSSSVLRMIFNVFSEEDSKSALRDYLTNHTYNTVQPKDLWDSFESYISFGKLNITMEDVMRTWTDQIGYPVVHAHLESYKLTLSQEKFRLDSRYKGKEFYWIPIDIATSTNSKYMTMRQSIWLGSDPQTVFINPINEWFIVNIKQTGFYRVNYDIISWKRLINELNSLQFKSIHVLNRAQIIDDLFNLARASYVNYELLLNATEYLVQETSHHPWRAFYNGLSYVYERFQGQSNQTVIEKYVLDLISDMYHKLGFNDFVTDRHLDELNREMFLKWSCKLNKSDCVEKSVDLFAAWRNDLTERISPNARPAVYCTAITKGNEDDWNFLWNQYLQTNFASEKKNILNALGCSTNQKILYNYLKIAISNPENIRKQDAAAVFESVNSASEVGVNVMLKFLMENIETIHSYFRNWDDVGTLFYKVAFHISTQDQLDMLDKFLEENGERFPHIRAKLTSAVTIATQNLDWYKKYSNTIISWIENKYNQAETDDISTILPLDIMYVITIAIICSIL